MYIIAGLGNPGPEYAATKHNIGFVALDFLAEQHDIKIQKIKHRALVGEGTIGGQKVLLVKPQTYMNASGESLREIMTFYKEPMDHLIVLYDDIDIPMGTIRVRPGGSAGTHNGMRSIIYQLQNDGFPRIRIGMGGERKGDLADYVISPVSKDHRDQVADAVRRACSAAETIVRQGVTKAMNDFNARPKDPEQNK